MSQSGELLSSLLNSKCQLRPCQVRVTNPDGSISIECRQDNGGFGAVHEMSGTTSDPFMINAGDDFDMSEIIPGLFLTSMDVVDKEELLRQHGVTHILTMNYPYHSIPEWVEKHWCPMPDESNFPLIDALEECCQFIDKVLDPDKGTGKVLVHCIMGISRSPSIVIGYLMTRRQMSFEEALKLTQTVRPVVNPNSGFIEQLRALDKQKVPPPAPSKASQVIHRLWLGSPRWIEEQKTQDQLKAKIFYMAEENHEEGEGMEHIKVDTDHQWLEDVSHRINDNFNERAVLLLSPNEEHAAHAAAYFLVRRLNMPLNTAFLRVKVARPASRPNMALLKRLCGASD